MALKKCTECGKEVSTAAKSCPNCGKKNPTGGMTFAAKFFFAIIGLAVIGQVMKGGSTPVDKSANKEAEHKDNLNTCFMVSVKAAKEGTNDAPRESPQYKEIYNTAFDVCLKNLEPKSVDAASPAPASTQATAPDGGAALELCVMSNRCDDDTNRMLNRVGSILRVPATTIQRDLRSLYLGERPSTILFDIGIFKSDIDVARASADGLYKYLDGRLRNFIAYCDTGGKFGCNNSAPLRPL